MKMHMAAVLAGSKRKTYLQVPAYLFTENKIKACYPTTVTGFY